MRRLRLAAASRCWSSALRDTLPAIARLGYTGVQFDVREELPPTSLSETGRRDFNHLRSELGLTVASTVFPLRRALHDPLELDRKLAALRDAMQFSYQLGAQTLCFRIGPIPPADRERERTTLQEILSDLARSANHLGVTLAITPTNDQADVLRSFLATITTGPVAIDFDPAHFAMTGQTTTEALRQLHGFVGHVQLRDGLRALDGRGEETAVGCGVVDWLELLALLQEMDYSGWLTAIRQEGTNRPADIAQAIAVIEQRLPGSTGLPTT